MQRPYGHPKVDLGGYDLTFRSLKLLGQSSPGITVDQVFVQF